MKLGDYKEKQLCSEGHRKYSQECSEPIIEDSTNFLVMIATPLLTLITQIRHTSEQRNIPKLHSQIVNEIKNFDKNLAATHYSARIITAARYCLCTAIDEAVLSKSWGAQSMWVQQSLLNYFHRETWGGERFYVIAETMTKESRKNIDFLEFSYYLLSLGFEGKFYGDNISIREEIRNRIFYRIRSCREKPGKTLSPHWRDQQTIVTRNNKNHFIKKTILITGSMIFLSMIYYNIKTYYVAVPLYKKLSGMTTLSPITTFSDVLQRDIVDRGVAKSE